MQKIYMVRKIIVDHPLLNCNKAVATNLTDATAIRNLLQSKIEAFQTNSGWANANNYRIDLIFHIM